MPGSTPCSRGCTPCCAIRRGARACVRLDDRHPSLSGSHDPDRPSRGARPMTRVAVIGLGAATNNIHLPALRLLGPRVQVVAGCDPDPAARERATTKWKIPQVFAALGEMLGA